MENKWNDATATRSSRTSHCLWNLLQEAPHVVGYRLLRIDSKQAPNATVTHREHAVVAQLALPYSGIEQGDVLLEVNGQLMLGVEQEQIDQALHEAADSCHASFVLLRQEILPPECNDVAAAAAHEQQQHHKEKELDARLKRGEECLRRLECTNTRLFSMLQGHKEHAEEEKVEPPNQLLWEEVRSELSSALQLNPYGQLKNAIESEAMAVAHLWQMNDKLESLQRLLEEKNAQLIALERQQVDCEYAAMHECTLLRHRLDQAQLSAASHQQQYEHLLELWLSSKPASSLDTDKAQADPPQPAPRKSLNGMVAKASISAAAPPANVPSASMKINLKVDEEEEDTRDFDLLQRAAQAQLKFYHNKNYRSRSESGSDSEN